LSVPSSIAVDGGHIYVTESGASSVWQVDKMSGQKTLLASNQDEPLGIAVDDTYVYWASNLGSAILRAAIGSSQAASVLYPAQGPSQVAVDAVNVYWLDNGGLRSAPKAGSGTVATLADPSYPGLVPNLSAADATHFYASRGVSSMGKTGWIFASIDKSTGKVTSLHDSGGTNPSDQFYGAAANDTSAYFFETYALYPGIPAPNPYVNTLWQISKSGGVSSSYGVPVRSMSGMTADNCSVYFASGTSIYRITPGATAPLELTTNAVTPGQIVVDDTFAYWVDQTWIGRVPK
jgi:hypothetical protein